MGRVRIDWAPAAGKILSGSYTLSSGITPSIVSLECIPFAGEIAPVSDVVFADGATTLTLKDCRIVGAPKPSRSSGGTIWHVQLMDRRWRWKYGVATGQWNREINQILKGVSQDDTVPYSIETDEIITRSARDLGGELLDVMGEVGYDIAKLPADDFPEIDWDNENPAKALANLCDLYNLLICYDPGGGGVKLCEKGDGQDLPKDDSMLSDDIATVAPEKPKTLRGLCGRRQYEVELRLEPVGVDADGKIKHIDNLSYKPAGGWSGDFWTFAAVADTECKDPLAETVSGNANTQTKTTFRKLALATVFKWYRIASPQSISGFRRNGALRRSVLLPWILPISSDLLESYLVPDGPAGQYVTRQRQAVVRGVFAKDVEAMGNANSTEYEEYAGNFSIDEAKGIVKFSDPVFQWTSSLPIAADPLYLRCVVFGDRYEFDRPIGGDYGLEPVDCSHLVVKHKWGVELNAVQVKIRADVILDARQAEFNPVEAGSRSYVGIKGFRLDGKIQQSTWSIGPSGANTEASVNGEHDPWTPPMIARRQQEQLANLEKYKNGYSSDF